MAGILAITERPPLPPDAAGCILSLRHCTDAGLL
jgi:hypothetical protein